MSDSTLRTIQLLSVQILLLVIVYQLSTIIGLLK